MEIEMPCYTLINCPPDLDPPNEMFLKLSLERGDTQTKTETLKKIICYISNGERLPGILMHIIRFVMPSQDHTLKKLMLIFWEIVPKTRPDGGLLQEIILVCDAYRKDLEHPNEYVRGATLRFLCKLKEPELLEPLMTPIRNCLEHKSSYVRRNAVLAIFTIYRSFPSLIPDAAELVLKFLEMEKDMPCKRNAFLMLLHTDLEKALSYLVSCLDEVTSFGDILQLMVVQLMHKVCLENPQERSRFIRIIYNLLNAKSSAVRYEAAGTLITLTNAPTAVKAAASCYIDIIAREADNNIKLIVLERLISLKENPNYERVLQDLVMEVLRVLACTDLEVKEKTLNFVLDLVTLKTVGEASSVLKKELVKIRRSPEQEDSSKYFQLVIKCLYLCSVKYKEVAPNIVPFLMGSLSSNVELITQDLITYVKELIHKFHCLSPMIINKLLEIFPSIKCLHVHRAVIWILGENVNSIVLIEKTLKHFRNALGKIPLVEDELKFNSENDQKITFDRTLQQYSYDNNMQLKRLERPILRQYLIDGDFIIGSVLSVALVKLANKYIELTRDRRYSNNFLVECSLIISSILHLGRSGLSKIPINSDDSSRMLFCIRVLAEQCNLIKYIFNVSCRNAFTALLDSQNGENNISIKSKSKTKDANEVDDTVVFFQLSSSKINFDVGSFSEISLNQAITGNVKNSSLDFGEGKIIQLTGFSDPVYAEAKVQPNQYDIVLDVLIVNQTEDLLENCTLELATLGHLRLVEKPQPCVLSPRDWCTVRAVIKVSSTESGVVLGRISYDLCGEPDRGLVVLSEVRLDAAEHLRPADCSEADFRSMWAEFEWENKVCVETDLRDLGRFLELILRATNMRCLAPAKVLHGSCGILVANLYAKSVFGEDALANVSLEKPLDSPGSPVTGHIRIRAKSQGMALYLGEMMNKAHKK